MQEAAAYNIPSIVVHGSSSAENIIDGENGFTIENDPLSLSNKIGELMKNRHAILQAGIGARSTIHHSWEEIVKTVHSRYQEIIITHKSNSSYKKLESKHVKEVLQLQIN
jgi:glycosyltransferase involved in cell wall biosynthesis